MSGAGVSHSRGGPTWEALRDAVAMVFEGPGVTWIPPQPLMSGL